MSSLKLQARLFVKGMIVTLPLSIAVIPWGILVGSFALDAGLSPFQGQSLSLFMFAGAGQLVAMGMVKAGAGLLSLVLTTLIITSRHLLYGLSMRDKIKDLPWYWRFSLGFLLTDELFAICGHQTLKTFSPWYALGSGIGFYIFWNISTFLGIYLGKSIDLSQYGLSFAIAATFIAILVPLIRSRAILLAILTSTIMVLVLDYFHIEASLILASLSGMSLGYFVDRFSRKKDH